MEKNRSTSIFSHKQYYCSFHFFSIREVASCNPVLDNYIMSKYFICY